MKALRRILGLLVMVAGLLGLILSAAGLVGLWMVKPSVLEYVSSTVSTLNNSIRTSQQVMSVTRQALGATVDSVDALSVMLSATAASVEETAPVIEQMNTLLGKNLPDTLESAAGSLKTAQDAAVVLDSTIKSLEAFQTAMSAVPIVSRYAKQPAEAYNPQQPLADSLGEVATDLEELPAMLIDMADNLSQADDNLVSIQTSLTTMSVSVEVISRSLSDYDRMIAQSQSSMDSLEPVLTVMQDNAASIVDWAVVGLSLFLLWLLVIQVVILSQGWELYQGSAGRMESGEPSLPSEQDPANK